MCFRSLDGVPSLSLKIEHSAWCGALSPPLLKFSVLLGSRQASVVHRSRSLEAELFRIPWNLAYLSRNFFYFFLFGRRKTESWGNDIFFWVISA